MRQRIFTLPNILTMSRLPLAVLIIFSLSYTPFITYGLLLFSFFLDFLDGYAARKLNQSSKLGAILDPLFDRVFVIILVVYLFAKSDLPPYFLFLFFTRDVFTVTGAFIFLITKIPKNIEIKARALGKVVTVLQFITVFLMVSKNEMLTLLGGYAIFVFSILALADYGIYLRKKMIRR